jgi:predicted dehydrogenase
VTPLRIGILGSARISLVALIEPALEVPGVTVAAVGAREKERAEAFALRHAFPTAHGSYEDLLADPEIDAIYNPLPNSLHGAWTLKAIEAGKHVLCEKPFASNAAEAERVAAAARDSGLVVMEAMHYRYHPQIERLREVVRELGPVQHLQAWTSFAIVSPGDIRYDYALAGGALMDGGCYAIDCLRLLGGDDARVLGAVADPVGDDPQGREADRAIGVRLAFGSGATGWFDSAFTRDGEFRADLHVICRDGEVQLDNFIFPHRGTLTVSRDGDVVSTELGGGETSYVYQLRAFAAAVEAGPGGDPPLTSADSAVTTMRVIDDCYRAAGLALR